MYLKKKLVIFVITAIVFIFFENTSRAVDINSEIMNQAQNSLGIQDFVKETEKYSEDFFEGTSISEMLNSAIAGKFSNSTIVKKILGIFGREFLKTLRTLVSILIIVLIHSILKSIADGLENSDVSKVVYYTQYILIVTLIISNFSDIIVSISKTISNLIGFMNTLVPILITLMIFTGSITTSGLLEPMILFIVEFVGNIINTLILPSVSIITALVIVSKISDKIQLTKLAKFMKSSVVWLFGVVLTIFVGAVSLEGTLGSSIDGITAKTAKATVSSLIPVVGKILGDSVDSILGCGLVLKNAIGFVGVLVIIGIGIIPILKLATLTIMYSVSAAIMEPLADEKVIKLLEEFSDIFKLLLAILCSVSILFIIGVTLIVKMSNSGMMYR